MTDLPPLAAQIGRRFVQRMDVKAVQMPASEKFPSGSYVPDVVLQKNAEKYGRTNPHGVGFLLPNIIDHLQGKYTYGHYLLDSDSNCKMFAYDIDLRHARPGAEGFDGQPGYWMTMPPYEQVTEGMPEAEWEKLFVAHPCDPYSTWRNHAAREARTWFKWQMKDIANRLCAVIQTELGLDCAAAYSGNKGVHVYGFLPEPMPAEEAKAAAILGLELLGGWEAYKGENFFKSTDQTPEQGCSAFSIEVFPKQTTIKNDGGYGNLMRLPLGRNLKSNDPTFFLDFKTPAGVLSPHSDPLTLLTSGNPFL